MHLVRSHPTQFSTMDASYQEGMRSILQWGNSQRCLLRVRPSHCFSLLQVHLSSIILAASLLLILLVLPLFFECPQFSVPFFGGHIGSPWLQLRNPARLFWHGIFFPQRRRLPSQQRDLQFLLFIMRSNKSGKNKVSSTLYLAFQQNCCVNTAHVYCPFNPWFTVNIFKDAYLPVGSLVHSL